MDAGYIIVNYIPSSISAIKRGRFVHVVELVRIVDIHTFSTSSGSLTTSWGHLQGC